MIENKNPQQAWDFMQANTGAVLVDVRTNVEFSFVGHPIDAVNIPWKEAPDWQVNANFVAQVQTMIDDIKAPILLMCRSGQRSMDAAKQLEQAGYQQLINIAEGFEGVLDNDKHRGNISGWRFHNLPWKQS